MSTAIDDILAAGDINEILGLAVGAGSTCWENMSGTGVFNDKRAGEILTAARQRISELSKTQWEQVREFHQAMGQPAPDHVKALPIERVAVRVELIREEFAELMDALVDLDLVETVDACIDLLYVVNGLLVECGVNPDPHFNEVHRSNMSKFGADGKPIIAGPNDPDGIFEGRVKKGPNYFKPNLTIILQEQGWRSGS